MSTTAVVATKSRTAWFFLLLALASLMWSGQGTAVKVLDRHMGPIAITFVPFYITTVLLVPLLLKMRRENPGAPSLSAHDWVQFTIAGVGGQVLAQLGMTWGVSKSLASNGAILNLLIPVISAVLASLMLRERITLLRVAALTIGLIGVVLMSISDWKQASFGEMRFLVGNLLILCGCLGSSFYNVYCKGLMKRFGHLIGHNPRDDVAGTTGREWNNDGYRSRRIVVRCFGAVRGHQHQTEKCRGSPGECPYPRRQSNHPLPPVHHCWALPSEFCLVKPSERQAPIAQMFHGASENGPTFGSVEPHPILKGSSSKAATTSFAQAPPREFRMPGVAAP